MGNCKYCGKSAGLFFHSHKACEEKHKQGLNGLADALHDYFAGRGSMSGVLGKVKVLQTDNFLSNDDLVACSCEALRTFAKAIRLPITKQHLQLVDVFLQNVGVTKAELNADGALDAVGTRLYQGVLMSYFAEDEPMPKVEKRAQMVSRVVPISNVVKEKAGYIALDKAAHKYLADGLISDSEQQRLDEFTTSLSLSLTQVPNGFDCTNIVKIRQCAILRQLQRGQLPPSQPTTQPIMLAAGEVVLWQYSRVYCYQEKIVKEWVGRSSGWSYRVMKGVYYHTGGSRGHAVEHTTMECLGTGSLVLTDRNMIFFSSLKSVKIPYKKLIGVTPYSDGIGVQRDGANAKRQVFQGFDSWFVMNLLSYIHI